MNNRELMNVRGKVSSCIGGCNEIIRKGKEWEESNAEIRKNLADARTELQQLLDTSDHIKDIYKNIQAYSLGHTQLAEEMLMKAVNEAGTMVPDADVGGIHMLTTESNHVTIVNGLGQDINLREGGGYRAVLGALLRYACLKAQPEALQFILFDEFFFTLSDITTSLLKDVLERMKEDTAIVIIDQRGNVVDGIVDYEYTFEKDVSKNTTINCTYVRKKE